MALCRWAASHRGGEAIRPRAAALWGMAEVINPVSGYSGPAMRTGPGHNCTVLIRPAWGAWLPMNCYRYGDSVNGVSTWTAVHYGGHFGWVSDYHLSGNGSIYPC